MELFVINRYTGDEPIREKSPNEEHLRKKLQKKINKRKRRSELEIEEHTNVKHVKEFEYQTVNSPENAFTTVENVETKRRDIVKDVKSVEDNKPTTVLENLDDNESTDKILKKKKKIKKSQHEKSSDEEIETDTEVANRKLNEVTEKEKRESGFTIIGDVHISKKDKIKRKLPNWLANPSVVSVDLKHLTFTVDSIPELDKIFIDKLKENNIFHFFPVQSQVIPWLLKNAERPEMYWASDICVSAPTGSGKTLAFVLPILQILYKRIVPKIRALVVLPVHDLANQVFEVFKTFSEPTNLNVLLLSKTRPFEEEQFLICKNDGMGNYRTVVDIIVTTPGCLVDHITKTKGLCFKDLRYLIIDEADRVMENAQNDWLYHLNKHINSECIRSYQIPIVSYNNMINKRRPPNKLLFSATLSQDPEKLQQLGLFQPELFTSVVKSTTSNETGNTDKSKFIGKYTTPAELTEYYINSSKTNKPLVLHHLLKSRSWKNVLCFVNSAEATSRLAFVLEALNRKDKENKIGKLSSNLTIKKRNLVLKNFLSGKINVLISSDALARGIDIPNIHYVISYDAPKFIKTYIHRIGRTGRAGKPGTSVALLTPAENIKFQKMIETVGKTSVNEININEEELEQYQSSYEKALTLLGAVLEKEKEKSIVKLKIKKRLQLRVAKGRFHKKNLRKKLKVIKKI